MNKTAIFIGGALLGALTATTTITAMDTTPERVHIQAEVADFTTEALMGDETISDVSLSDYRGSWTMLYFYPADGTTVCPTELRELYAERETFERLGVEVLPISTQDAASHLAWKPNLEPNFDFTWLSDVDGDIARQFGVYTENNVAARGTFLIDPDGVLQIAHVNNENVGRSTEEIIRTVEATQTGELCGASWTPGEEHLDADKDAVPLADETEEETAKEGSEDAPEEDTEVEPTTEALAPGTAVITDVSVSGSAE